MVAQKLTAVIVDDEFLARENLQLLLEEFCPEIQVIGSAGSVKEGKKLIEEKLPQVLFLDIRMPSGSEGFDLLASLSVQNFQVVFVTAFKDYAIQALNANAIHYILKPIDIEDLQFAVKKLWEYHGHFESDSGQLQMYSDSLKNLTSNLYSGNKHQKITLFHSKGFKIADTQNIVRLQADGNCTAFFFKDSNKYLDTKTLKVYERLLGEKHFIRIHKSHLINLYYLKEYSSVDGHFAIMKDGASLPIARGRLSHFLSTIKDFTLYP